MSCEAVCPGQIYLFRRMTVRWAIKDGPPKNESRSSRLLL